MATHSVKQKSLVVNPSSRKLNAAHLFERVAVTVSDGSEYGLHELVLPQATLSQARAAWKRRDPSLAAVVIDERDQS